MNQPASSPYLERRTYRRRRMIDAVRLLPILGILLFLVPLLWSTDNQDPAATARGFVYIFAIWAGLIVLAAGLTRLLRSSEPDNPGPTE